MIIDLAKLTQKSYWFDPAPPATGGFVPTLAAIFAIMVGLGVLIFFVGGKKLRLAPYRTLRAKFLTFFLVVGLGGLLLVFFRFEGIPYFANRLLLGLLAAGAIGWFLSLIFFLKWQLPRELKRLADLEIFQKYLPKKKG